MYFLSEKRMQNGSLNETSFAIKFCDEILEFRGACVLVKLEHIYAFVQNLDAALITSGGRGRDRTRLLSPLWLLLTGRGGTSSSKDPANMFLEIVVLEAEQN